MHKLLVLGSDYGTLAVVKEAKAMGIYTVVADLMSTSPTKEEADEAWLVSTTDIDYLVEKCKEEQISAVMYGASDFNISNARQICKQLGLPIYCENDDTWSLVRDKRAFKSICKEVGARVPLDFVLDDCLHAEQLKQIVFPVVCKPSDKSGNRGMSYCNNEEELIEGYRSARAISDKPIIVERQLHGSEYNVHYVLANGEARLLYLNATYHQPGEKENLYSFKCTTSAHLQQYLEEMNESAKRIIKKVGCKEGIAWFDCIRDEDGHFYFLEMGHRFGGVMTYVPYEQVYGFNAVRWMLECALGVTHRPDDLPQELHTGLRGCAGSYHLFTNCDGEIDRIEGLEILKKIPNVFIDMPKREGGKLRNQTNSGLIGIYGGNIDEICDTIRIINDNLKILNKQGQNMFVYFNDYKTLREDYKLGLSEFGM